MLFYSFFKSLVGKDVVVELKNDLSLCGTLHSVDQYLNIKVKASFWTIKDLVPQKPRFHQAFAYQLKNLGASSFR